MTPDIGVGITPIIVYGYAKMVARTYVESILGLEKDHPMPKSLQKNPRTFPSLFTYWFSYYFLYLTDQNVKVRKNDFNDLSLTLAAPICQRFYTEKRLAHVLNEVKGYELPSDRMVIDAASKNGTPSKTKQERRVELAFYSNARGKLLQRTSIYPFSKMLLHLKEQDKHLK